MAGKAKSKSTGASGGWYAKVGDRYESRWTVRHLLELLDGRATEMRIEPPGVSALGVEFYVRRPPVITEFHQAKRRYARLGKWTFKVLADEGVMKTSYDKLASGDARFVFVSEHAAVPLDRLCELARLANDTDEFLADFLDSQTLKDGFKDLCAAWGKAADEDAFDRVRRVLVRTLDEDSIREWNEERARALVGGDPATANDVLAAFANDTARETLTPERVRDHLVNRGFGIPTWAGTEEVRRRVAESAAASLRRTALGFAGHIVQRPEAAEVVRHLEDPNGPRRMFVTGAAGSGKSAVLNQVVSHFVGAGWPVFALVLDDISDKGVLSAVDIGHRFELPTSPTAVLASFDEPSLLVIDQLDRATFDGERPHLAEAVKRIARDAMAHPHLRVVIASRAVELKADTRLRTLMDAEATHTVDVGPLREDVVIAEIERVGFSSDDLDKEQIQLLSHPICLYDFVESAQAGMPLDFKTERDLIERFEQVKREAHG